MAKFQKGKAVIQTDARQRVGALTEILKAANKTIDW